MPFFGFSFYFFHLLLWSCRGNWNCPPAWWSAGWSSVRITLCWNCWLITILVWLIERYYILLLRTVIRNAFSLWMSTSLCCSWFFATSVLDLFVLCSRFLNVFTRESSYCFQRILAIAILSVRLSHGWIRQKRSKLSPLAVWKTLVSGTIKLFHKFEGGHPERGC